MLDRFKIFQWLTIAYMVVLSIYVRGVIDPVMGIDKLTVYILPILAFFLVDFKVSIVFLLGLLCLIIQFFVAKFHPESFRLSTLLYSFLLMMSFVSVYTFVYNHNVFTLKQFIRLVKTMITIFFIVCVIQQILILVGFRHIPWLNLSFLGRGIGCSSLSYEPSSFARFMFVYYFAYIKCNGYLENKKLTIKDLFSESHRKITLMFLWMMTTMGSGTAFVCLSFLLLVFVTKYNWYYVVPSVLIAIFVVLPMFDFEQSNRATKVMSAMTTLDQKQVEMADGSGASRINPLLNSLSVDLTKKETWLGYGTDYAAKHNFFVLQKGTLFDDYGLIWYIFILIFSLSSTYGFSFFTILLMFSGLAGGANGNINYSWGLMFIVSCVRYFELNRNRYESE